MKISIEETNCLVVRVLNLHFIRFWHSSAAYAIALEAKCGSEANIPPKGHSIYQWPGDLLKPSAVIFLELSEEDRMSRLRERGVTETDEEMKLKKSRLLRQRQVASCPCNLFEPPHVPSTH